MRPAKRPHVRSKSLKFSADPFGYASSPSVKTSPPMEAISPAVASSCPLAIAMSPAPTKTTGPGACGNGGVGDGPGTGGCVPGDGVVGDLLHCANRRLIATALRHPSTHDRIS